MLKKQRAAVFKKARKLNAANSSGMTDLSSENITAVKQDFLNESVNNETMSRNKDDASRFVLQTYVNLIFFKTKTVYH